MSGRNEALRALAEHVAERLPRHVEDVVLTGSTSRDLGLAHGVEPLAVKPERFAERIDAAIHTLDLQALRALAAETLALAPQTDKTRLALERLLERL